MIPRTLSLAINIGRSLRESNRRGINPVDGILDITKGIELFKGKIVYVARFNVGGFAKGEAKIEGLDECRGHALIVKFQNENLIAIRDGELSRLFRTL